MNIYPNKIALISGGARRLGRDIAFAVADSGFDIVLNYHSSPNEIIKETVRYLSEKKIEVIPYKADFSNPDEIKRIYYYIKNRFNRLDLVVNNAAIFRKVEFDSIDADVLDEFYKINLRSVILSVVNAAELMKKNEQKPSRIINISSLGGIENWTGYIPYSVAKAGVIKFTKLAAKKLAPNITVNSISPGTVLIDDDKNENVDYEEVKKYPMKRFGKSADIKSLIKFLITENTYITGHNFIVDGGKIL
jgi:NAD(P)-dependent dehydrogenase (short-subunit alcohol dehydrogenase family)